MNNQLNNHEKYDTKNPIAIKLIKGFMNSIDELTQPISNEVSSVIECGCGQGHVNRKLELNFKDASISGFDINGDDVEIARTNKHFEKTKLSEKDIYTLSDSDRADLVVCCEVLEHLEFPEKALNLMASLNAKYYLFSVPNEPTWRILNLLRGKYLKDWGNTPDHCNHWSTRQFKKFIGTELSVIETRKPLPWTMVLAKSND